MSVKRIIPWALPPIAGGSQGGYTPRPGPTPTPTGPYDFSDFTSTISCATVTKTISNWYDELVTITSTINLSGIKVNDASNVASVILTVDVAADDLSTTIVDSSGNNIDNKVTVTKSDKSIDYDISNIASMIGGTVSNTFQPISVKTINSTTGPFSNAKISTSISDYSVKITVYNENGVIIQEWQPEEEEE